ncbi:hypothetical protein P6166_12655 [Stenotrophomonas sp. HITSZ_GD]|jgi:hypothetical protein|uniref:hypothetical protein n=1 Tax=Stenotrophomonas sp. HITSZ_GD TaxID=3037248 RepID=UPI00240DDF0E|nr:hypothetical protein [Stenotrophomonas sp. HITSZ_GD]MDG2526206.1 hypothetical protein [Stenotrophomonas sp. HITSZ_GD]
MKAPRLALPARLVQSRRASLLLFGCTLGALVVAAVWFTLARGSLGNAYDNVGQREQALGAAQQRLQEARLRVQLADGARQLVTRASNGGYLAESWGERLINLNQAPLGRAEGNELLDGVARDPARLFGAEAFEISVTRAEDGLFDLPPPRSPPLLVTLRGTLLFRTQVQEAP